MTALADLVLPPGTTLENFKPIGGQLVIAPEERPRGLIILPDGKQHEGYRGTILLAAEELDEDLRPGQEVLFSPYAHRVLELNGNLLYLVHSSDVLARLDNGEGNT